MSAAPLPIIYLPKVPDQLIWLKRLYDETSYRFNGFNDYDSAKELWASNADDYPYVMVRKSGQIDGWMQYNPSYNKEFTFVNSIPHFMSYLKRFKSP